MRRHIRRWLARFRPASTAASGIPTIVMADPTHTLVVDDDPGIRDSLEPHFNRQGFSVGVAPDGRTTEAAFSQAPVILMSTSPETPITFPRPVGQMSAWRTSPGSSLRPSQAIQLPERVQARGRLTLDLHQASTQPV